MKRVIITGGTGFVGANLARRLVHNGHSVHLLVRPKHTTWRIADLGDAVQLHVIDLFDGDDLVDVVSQVRPDWIFHLATYGAYSSQADPLRIMQTNVIGTVNLVEACLRTGFEAFINTGSSSEYGFKNHPPHEDEQVEPNSHYSVAKVSATLYCRYTAKRYRVHLPTLRLYSVYGPFEEPTRLIPTLLAHGFERTLPPLVSPDIVRDYVYIDDVVAAYLLAATRRSTEEGAIYNVGVGVQTSLRTVVDIARREMGITDQPVWGSMPDRQWDTTVWIANSQKIRATLGWQPQYDFVHGFRAAVEWYRANPNFLQPDSVRGIGI
jgi:UDP-glucose 4-epimerase